MKKIEIDLLASTNLNSIFDVEPSFPIVHEENLIIGLNSVDSGIKRNEFSIASYKLSNGAINWETIFRSEWADGIKCNFQIIKSNLIGCSSYKLFSIDLATGKLNWSKKLKKHTSTKISNIEERIFWSNWGELQEINPANGQKIKSLKPRVKWFDSRILKNGDRYYISTSNSKILELDLHDLTIKNEFKFKGGWAMACEPYFFRNLMISNSYGSKTKVFDLNDNSAIKSFNRKTGSKPIQNGINEFFFSYHGNGDNKLNCFDVLKLKKKWTKDVERIQYLNGIGDSLEFIYKEDGSFKIAKLDMNEPNDMQLIAESKFQNWDNYPYDLWDGVGIINNENWSIYNYEPNKILCIMK